MKKLIIGTFIALCLAVALLLALPSFIDWNAQRNLLEARLSVMIGQPVTIAGDVNLDLLPTPILRAEAVQIAGDEEGRPLAVVEAVDLRMAFLPLLSNQFDIEQAILIKPVVVIPPGTSETAASVLRSGARAGRLRLDRLNIENGSLVLGDGRTIDRIFGEVSADSLVGPWRMAGTGRFAGRTLRVDVSTNRMTDAGAFPLNATVMLPESGGRMRFAGLAWLNGRVQGEIQASTNDFMAATERLLARDLVPPELALPLTLSGQVEGDGQRTTLSALRVELGGTLLTGSATYENARVPTLDLAFHASRFSLGRMVDLPAMLAALENEDAAFTLPDDLTISLDLSADAVDWGTAPIRWARLQGLLSDGIVSVSRFNAQLPGGADLRAVGTLSGMDGRPHVDAGLELTANDLRILLSWAGLDFDETPSDRLRTLALRANVAGGSQTFQITGLELGLDGSRVTGGLTVRGGERPGIGARLTLDRLNLDAYSGLPPPAAPLKAALEWVARHGTELASVDANLDVTAEQLTAGGVTMNGLHIDGGLSDGAAVLRDVRIDSVAGASVSLSGHIGNIAAVSDMDLTLELETSEPRRLLRLAALNPDWPLEQLGVIDFSGRLVGGVERAQFDTEATLADASLRVGGAIDDPLGAPVLDVAVRALHNDLLQALRLGWPGYAPRGALGDLDLFARLSGSPSTLAIDELYGQVGPVALRGEARLNMIGLRPTIEAEVVTGRLAIDPFLPEPEARFVEPGATLWPAEPFRWPVLDAVDARLALTAEAIEAGGLSLEDRPALAGRLTEGRLYLDGIDGALLGGRFNASAMLAPGDAMEARVEATLVDADLEAVTGALGADGLAGSLDLTLTAEGQGSSPAELIADLAGGGLLVGRDGVVDGMDLAEAATALQLADGPLAFLEVLQGPLREGRSPWLTLNAPFVIDGGVVRSDEVRWRLEDGVAEGSARFDLSTLRLGADLALSLFALPDAPPLGLSLSGPLERIERRLETEALRAHQAAARPREDGAQAQPGPVGE